MPEAQGGREGGFASSLIHFAALVCRPHDLTHTHTHAHAYALFYQVKDLLYNFLQPKNALAFNRTIENSTRSGEPESARTSTTVDTVSSSPGETAPLYRF